VHQTSTRNTCLLIIWFIFRSFRRNETCLLGILPLSLLRQERQVAVGQFPFGPGAAKLMSGGDWPTRMGKSHPSHHHMWSLMCSLALHPAAIIIGNCHVPVCLLRSRHGVASPWPLGWRSPASAHHWSGGTAGSSAICP